MIRVKERTQSHLQKEECVSGQTNLGTVGRNRARCFQLLSAGNPVLAGIPGWLQSGMVGSGAGFGVSRALFRPEVEVGKVDEIRRHILASVPGLREVTFHAVAEKWYILSYESGLREWSAIFFQD